MVQNNRPWLVNIRQTGDNDPMVTVLLVIICVPLVLWALAYAFVVCLGLAVLVNDVKATAAAARSGQPGPARQGPGPSYR